MYGWYSKTQQERVCRKNDRPYPYIYYIDKQDKIVLVTEVNKGKKICYDDAISLGELKKFYKALETPLYLE